MTGALVRHVSIAALCMAFLLGCGYRIIRPSVDAVRIGAIENNTHEARLEERLARALASELLENGIRIDESSGYTVEGTIERLSLETVAEKDELVTTYRIIITGRFFLRGPDGEPRRLPGSGKYITTFSGRGPLTSVVANKELAMERATEDMAEEMAAAVLYMK